MSGYRDDDFDRRDDERSDPDRDARAVAAARGMTALPALFLVLNGLLGLVCVALLFVPMVLRPDMPIKAARDLVAQQPQGKDRQDAEEQLDEAENELQQNLVATQIQNAVELGVLALGNLVAVLGGLAMRGLGSYGLSFTGAVVTIVPVLTGCCCTGILFGVWSVLVLVRPEVKAGFTARRRGAYSPDTY